MENPLSRWQKLYSSSSLSSSNKIQRSIHSTCEGAEEDDESVTAWLDNFQSGDIDISHYENHKYGDSPIKIGNYDEADRILDYMDTIFHDDDNDADLIESILESQRHKDAIIQHHIEKKSRSLLQHWKHYTKAQTTRRQFAIDICNSLISRHLISKIFKLWKYRIQNICSILSSIIAAKKTKMVGLLFCSWANQIWSQSQNLKLFRETMLKKRVFRTWRATKARESLVLSHFERYVTTRYWSSWKQAYLASKEVHIQQTKALTNVEEQTLSEHHYKITELMHFLDNKESFHLNNKENEASDDITGESKDKGIKAFHERWIPKTSKKHFERSRNNMKQLKAIDSEKNRNALKEKHIEAQKRRETRAYNAKDRSDEEERAAYIEQKREEKRMKLKKQMELEVAQKAWKLAKLHRSIVLLRFCFTTIWRSYVQTRRLLWVKAIKFSSDKLTGRCLLYLYRYTREKRIREEKNQFRNADKYFQLRVAESVMRKWNKLASNSHHLFYERVIKIRMHYNQCRVVNVWRTKLFLQRVQTIQLENTAEKLASRNNLRWIMRKLKNGVIKSRTERKEEQKVALKWKKIKEWLKD